MINSTCNACASSQHLTIHHIVPRSLGGHDGPDNYSVLCQYCHTAVHWIRPLDSLAFSLKRMQEGSRKYHRTKKMVERINDPNVREVLNRMRQVIKNAGKGGMRTLDYIRLAFDDVLFYEWLKRRTECPTSSTDQFLTMVM